VSNLRAFPVKPGCRAYRRHSCYPGAVHVGWVEDLQADRAAQAWWILFLLFPIILDITLWATFYYVSGALPSFEEALYFSTVTFTTVGYGDIVLGREWRQLATFEAVNGWIIFGWATALIVAVIQRLYFPPDAALRSK
jgi:voltage-gated potassium channel Kch